jgi:excisionase family DNA binding protein
MSVTDSPDQPVFDVYEAAEYLKCGPKTIRRLVRLGRLPGPARTGNRAPPADPPPSGPSSRELFCSVLTRESLKGCDGRPVIAGRGTHSLAVHNGAPSR